MAQVSVIVPARDAAATIGATLDALARQTMPPTEVIVADNGSLDDTARIVQDHSVGARLIERKRGDGPGAARNEGARAASGELLAFTDSDCEPAPDWIERGTSALARADLVQGRVSPVTPPGPFDHTIDVRADRGLFETANLLVTTEIFRDLGGFRDLVAAGTAGRPFGEDVDFGWRARRRGRQTTFDPTVVVYHAVFPGSARDVVTEALRRRFFPALLREVPELRGASFFVRIFLSRRTAAFDLALASLAAAALVSPFALAGIIPYTLEVGRRARRGGRRRIPLVAVVDVAADTVGFGALVWGSVTSRRPLL